MRDMSTVPEHSAGRDTAPAGSSSAPIRVLVISDTRLYREGLSEVFGRADSLEVVGTVAGPLDAVEVLAREAVGIVLIGLAADDTLDAARMIAAAHPGVRMVALAVEDRPEDVVPLAEAGVCGYVPRDAALADLVGTLRSVVRGESPCSPVVAAGPAAPVRTRAPG